MINKFPGICSCGARLEAGEGMALRDGTTGRWVVRHQGCATVTAVVPPAVSAQVVDLAGRRVDYMLMAGSDGKSYPASAHQATVFAAAADVRSGSHIIKAVAGSGKTTVLKNLLRYVPAGAHVQGFAFGHEAGTNLKVALEEVHGLMGEAHCKNMRMGTFHSLCLGAVCRYLNKKVDQLTIDSGKMRKLLKAWLSEDDMMTYGAFIAKLVAFAKGEGIGALVPDTDERWYALVEHHGLYLDSEDANEECAVALSRQALARSNEVSKHGIIDYDDMLYLVVLWKLRLWQNDLVLVDEAQDTNPVRRAVVRLALRPTGRLFAVGDPKQSIFGFTGASTDAMDLIARDFKTSELPLTVSYRCARAVVADAQQWVDYIEPSANAPEGNVRYGVPLSEALGLLTCDDAVLCRQTAPLIDLAYKLINQGRGVQILGKEIGEGLLNLIRAQKARTVSMLVKRLETWAEREAARFTAKGDETKAEAVRDRAACVMTLVDSLPEKARTVLALELRVTEVFRLDAKGEKTDGLLTLATIHKAKGSEWETVAILRPDLMPSRAARQDWQCEQEINLQYVAATRAKQTLLYLERE